MHLLLWLFSLLYLQGARLLAQNQVTNMNLVYTLAFVISFFSVHLLSRWTKTVYTMSVE